MTDTSEQPARAHSTPIDPSARAKLLGLVVLGCAVYWLWPRPEVVSPEGWRLFSIFVATIAGLTLRPFPGSVLILVALTVATLTGTLEIREALSGYANPVVWLVLSAFLIARALIKTGLARRIALLFVRAFGGSSLGTAYALVLSDLTLATIIPSNTARTGGVILPIARSLAELHGSHPGKTAGLLGAFLMTAVYQGECVAAGMFLTAQAGNAVIVGLARDAASFEVTWAGWALAALVPGLASLLGVPWLVGKLIRPEIQRTPEAPAFAREELAKMGPLDGGQKIVLGVFVLVCGMWVTSGLHGLPVTLTALCGACALFLTGVLSWDDAVSERNAWDVFIWYGGVVRLGAALNDYGLTRVFADSVGESLSGLGWPALFAVALLVYFYAHYGFASITMHFLAMFPPFVALLVSRGAPAGLTVYAFACLASPAAGLTHYGTVPAPMFFSQNYVSFRDWWKVGFLLSLWNLAVWVSTGLLWWKLIGLW